MTEPTADSAELQAIAALTDEIRGLRTDVRLERRGRRLSIAVMALALLIASVVFISTQHQTCTNRQAGRSDVRAAIRRAVDVVAVYADVEPKDRAKLLDQVTVAMIEELPPLNC